MTWLVLPNKRVKLEELSESVGRCISTKAVDSTERYDLTHEYKYPEGKGSAATLDSGLSNKHYLVIKPTLANCLQCKELKVVCHLLTEEPQNMYLSLVSTAIDY